MSWRGVDRSFANKWETAANNAHAAERIFAVPVGNTDADNLGIVNVLTETPMIVLQPTTVEVEIRQLLDAAARALPLTVAVDGDVVATTTVNIAAGETSRVTLPIHGAALRRREPIGSQPTSRRWAIGAMIISIRSWT